MAREVEVLHSDSRGYPRLLKLIQDPPDPLFVQGKILEQDALAVAIVGSRHPTPYGTFAAQLLARQLAQRGITIVSGMARGIDTDAHRATLSAQGRTIGVLGCGHDVDYPKGSRHVKEKLLESGALVTEFLHGMVAGSAGGEQVLAPGRGFGND